MDNFNDNIFQESEGLLNTSGKQYLLQTTKWAKFLAIVGFVFIGLAIIAMFFAMTAVGSFMAMEETSVLGGLGASTGIFIFYLLVMVLYIYPIYCLYKFSTGVKAGIHTNNAEQVANGLKYQKKMYVFTGVLMIILLSFYVLAFLFGGLAAAFL